MYTPVTGTRKVVSEGINVPDPVFKEVDTYVAVAPAEAAINRLSKKSVRMPVRARCANCHTACWLCAARLFAAVAVMFAVLAAADVAAILELVLVTESLSCTMPAPEVDAVGKSEVGSVPVVMRAASMFTLVAAAGTETLERTPDASMRATPPVCNADDALIVGPLSAPVNVPPDKGNALLASALTLDTKKAMMKYNQRV